MAMRFFIFILFSISILAVSCSPEPDFYKDPYNMTIDDIKIIPDRLTMGTPTKIVFNGCNFFRTYKVKVAYGNISVKKRFNSLLHWDCVPTSDTISLGYLFYGDYELNFEIIDLNPEVEDSIFYSSKKVFNVVVK